MSEKFQTQSGLLANNLQDYGTSDSVSKWLNSKKSIIAIEKGEEKKATIIVSDFGNVQNRKRKIELTSELVAKNSNECSTIGGSYISLEYESTRIEDYTGDYAGDIIITYNNQDFEDLENQISCDEDEMSKSMKNEIFKKENTCDKLLHQEYYTSLQTKDIFQKSIKTMQLKIAKLEKRLKIAEKKIFLLQRGKFKSKLMQNVTKCWKTKPVKAVPKTIINNFQSNELVKDELTKLHKEEKMDTGLQVKNSASHCQEYYDWLEYRMNLCKSKKMKTKKIKKEKPIRMKNECKNYRDLKILNLINYLK